MNLRLITLGTLLLGLTACGGEESTDTPTTFTDASAAVDAGDAAMTNNDFEGAANAYQYVVDNPPSDELKVSYAMTLSQALVGAKKESDAMDVLTGLATDHADLLSAKSLQDLADSFLKPGATASARMAEHVMNIAREALAEEEFAKFDVEKVSAAMAALESGDMSKLAELGYVGD
jgi:hypothetical protein